ncbi:hypothetical protein DB88DRAFT_208250 [Papiliotrema laurentii]|uniref:SWI5-dependent HO expression protein 3 n=1 Tax=Papiliotrema laurentii TaxID=5418 RepID=A0AAD9FT57_PAPLA|nr:hypothetical protein DB88DRAFT_208250 [Papiliotrema laurentii]
MLIMSYQNSAAYFADAGLGTPTTGSSRPYTPINGPLELPSYELSTPNGELDLSIEVDGDTTNGQNEENHAGPSTTPAQLGKSLLPRLPHSNSSFDLRSSAITPGKTPNVRKTSDGPLGLGRIPQSAVTQALALHAVSPSDSPTAGKRPPSRNRAHSPSPAPESANLRSPFLGTEPPYSPNGPSDDRHGPVPRKISSSGSAASTRVIDGLQTDLLNARGHNEKLKQEIRANQRLIGSLTRQNEDLKETKERMKVECEGLNNVISRKERLLQEVLERARTAESSLAQHLSTRKALEQSTKKSLQQMSAQLADAQAAQAKAESESHSLKDSVKSLKGVWARELKAAREEIRKAEEKGRKDLEDARQSHVQLVQLVESQASDRASIHQLVKVTMESSATIKSSLESRITELKAQANQSEEAASKAQATAAELAAELGHLRRLMREPRRTSLEDAAQALEADR